ncbi:MAG: cohesin domain-containing protein [Desulfuromusa sp.]|nr:cohesin domain-containing protein [Desulfuromusa sp.]
MMFLNKEVIEFMKIKNSPYALYISSLLLLLFLSACVAGQSSFTVGNQEFERKNYDQAVIEYLAAAESDPANTTYRIRLAEARNSAALYHKDRGDEFVDQKQYLSALQEYQLATELGGSIYTAFDGLKISRDHLQVEGLVKDAQSLLQANQRSQAKEMVEDALLILPDYQPALQLKEAIKKKQYALVDGIELEVTSPEPFNLNFNQTKLPDVFDILTKLSGINFILDEDVRSNKTTLFLEQATFSQALELLLQMNKLDKKILNKKTIILFPKTRDKQKQFNDQIIQTFYLSYMDAKKAVNMLRTMLQVRKIFVQEELNAIVIRDQPEVIKLAQKLIEANDRGNSEVVYDLELIEVAQGATSNIGLQLSNYSIGMGLSADGNNIASAAISPGSPTDGLLSSFRGLDSFYSIPTASFNFLKTQADADILANPKIRVRNNEKAKVYVGSREPVVTVTINDTQTSENVQYIDVGVKVDVEPKIQLDGTVVTKVSLEVSNVSGRETTSSGTSVITISTTNADTILTLKDGEQTVIGGLIRSNTLDSKHIIPGIGDIPIMGEVFNGSDKSTTNREILLSITPHIVKSVRVPQGDIVSIWSGGEDDLKFGRNFGTFATEYNAGQQGMETQADIEVKPVTPDKQKETIKPLEQPLTAAESTGSELVTEVVTEEVILARELTEQPARSMVIIEGPQLVNQGDEFTLSFHVDEIESLFSAPLYVQYDPEVFEFISAAEGTFLNQEDVSTVFTSTVLTPGGSIIIGLKQAADGQGISGGGELFSMQFRAKSVGKAEIMPTRTNFRNVTGEQVAVAGLGLMIEVGP